MIDRTRWMALSAAAGLAMGMLAWAGEPTKDGAPPAGQPAPAQPADAKPAEAKTPDAADLPSAESIIARHIEAIGGKDAASKLTSRRSEGAVLLRPPGGGPDLKVLTGTIVIELSKPNLLRQVMEIEGVGKTEQATDGTDVWIQSNVVNPSLAEGDDKAQFLLAAIIDADLNLTEHYVSVKTVGVEKVNDVEAHKLELAPKAGPVETRWYAKDTGLLIKSSTPSPTLAGEPGTIDTFLSDYRQAGPVKAAHAMKVVQSGVEFDIRFDKIEHNVDISKDRFVMPENLARLKKALQDGTAATANEQDAPPGMTLDGDRKVVPVRPPQPAPEPAPQPAPGGGS